MKILKRLSLAIITLFVLFSFTSTERDYVGKWKGEDKGDIGSITLSSDGYATFEFNGQIMGGKSYNHQGIDAAMKYTVNTKVVPTAIDFIIVQNKSKKELARLKGILKMKSKDEMQMALRFGGGGGRPDDFSKDVVVFNRVK